MTPLDHSELMHREIDGVNTAAESQRLHAHLAAHEASRAQYQELCEAVGLLSQVQPLDPPPQLRRRIHAAIETVDDSRAAPIPSTASRRAIWRIIRDRLRFEPYPRHAFAWGFLVGLLLTATVWQLVSPRGSDPVDNLQGTVLSQAGADHRDDSQTLAIALPGVSGRLRIDLTDAWARWRLDLTSEGPLQVSLRGDTSFHCSSYQASGPSVIDLEVGDRQIRLAHHGHGTYDLVLNHLDASVPVYTLEIIDSGVVIYSQLFKRERI